MLYDVTTIGDAMKDTFIFPDIEEMEKPVDEEKAGAKSGFDNYLVFGLGDKVTISDVDFSIGGTAANVATGLSRLGLKTNIVSSVGTDNNANDILDRLKEYKVGIDSVKIHKNKNSSFSVIVSYKGERTIFVYHAFRPTDFTLPDDLKSEWVYLGPMAAGYERIYNKVVNLVVKKNIKVAVNPGNIQIDRGLESFGGLKDLIEILFLNREEALSLSALPGHPTVKEIARAIQTRGPKMVVITDGNEGAYVYNGQDFLKVGPYPEKRLDSTGAGDAFASAFLASYIYQNSLQESLKWGVTNSASVITEIGAQEGLLSRASVKRKVNEYRWPQDSLRFS